MQNRTNWLQQFSNISCGCYRRTTRAGGGSFFGTLPLDPCCPSTCFLVPIFSTLYHQWLGEGLGLRRTCAMFLRRPWAAFPTCKMLLQVGRAATDISRPYGNSWPPKIFVVIIGHRISWRLDFPFWNYGEFKFFARFALKIAYSHPPSYNVRDNAITFVCLSVCLFPLYRHNWLTIDLEILCSSRSWP